MPSESPIESPVREDSSFLSQTNHLSPQERTVILRDYHCKVKELESNINVQTHRYLEPLIEEVDKINQDGTMEEKIKNSEEVVLDSKIMCVASKIIKKCSSKLLRDFSSYDSIEFAEKILQYVRRMPDTAIDENIEWSLLGKQIMRCFNKTAKFTMLLGTLRPIPKKEVTRRKFVKEAQAPVKRPENVITVDKVEESVEETVNGIKKLIHRYYKHNKDLLDFFCLVLHPTNYGKTIENILHISFLIKDGYIKFKIDEDGIPYVQECTPPKDQAKEKLSKNTRNIQNVLSLDMHKWRALVEAYGIKKPMIDLDSIRSKNTK